jgi:phosphate transport system permease protein
MAVDQQEKTGQLEAAHHLLETRSLGARHRLDYLVKGISTLGALIGLFFLVWILYEVILRGLSSFNWAFFTELPTPPGIAGGGVANAILGTVLITLLAAVMGTPIGILAGVYLAEFGKGSKLAGLIRSITNLLIGVPSIIVGVFVYTIMVAPMKSFSGLAGAVALVVIMLPVVVRTTDDMLNMVPNPLRESGLALGANRKQVTLGIVFRAARSGMLTGVLLAVARVSGETAPLLFTALNSPYWLKGLSEPTANLTVLIFNYAMSPYDDWISKAWGASLLIMLGVLALSIIARVAIRGKERKG